LNIVMTDLKGQYQSIKAEIDAAIGRVMQHSQFILGQEVKTFEGEMAAYCGTGFAVGVASGTDALHLALLACGVGPGDEVITTPFTFIATAGAVVNCNARPVFVDIDPQTYNMDPNKLAAYLKSRSPFTGHESRLKAIIPVHLYGQPADLDPIMAVAREHKLKVIEDCAQALGAEYRGKKVGSLGDAGCLSFFPAKNLGAYGDGGMVVTNDSKIADTTDMLRKHGSKVTYYHSLPGFNSRLDALQAAVLSVKLKYLEQWNDMRRRNAALYDSLLGQIPGIETTNVPQHCKPSCNYYTVRLKDARIKRAELRRHLESQGVQTMVYYPLSLHLQDVYKHLGYKPGDFPHSEKAQEEVLSLPMYPELSKDQIQEIVTRIEEFVRK
jgi:dTDP-4-amino-4,6-dideoxygalactose transaminase